jgi:hypothetical protein
VKEELIAGDTLDFTVSVPDYLPAAGWTLKYRLTPRFSTPSQTPITLTATTSGTDYLVQAAPATTATWSPGSYAWARWVEKTGARQTLDESGFLLVKADAALTAQGYDGRTQAAKAVDDLKAAMATFQATSGRVKRYTIGSREMEFETTAEIVKMIDYWQRQLDNENARADMAKGYPNPRNIGMRFNRV